MSTILGIALALAPFAAIIGLLRLAEHVSRRRELSRERQVLLTDAIHRELGAAAAPDVRQGRGGEWLVTMRVPLDRPGTVAALLGITQRTFAARDGAGTPRLRISLTPQTPRPALR